MTQNHIAQSAFAPAAADEYAEPCDHEAGEPDFDSADEEDAFWKGVSHGIRCAGREPGHPHMPVDFDLELTRESASASLVSSKLLEAAPPGEAASPAPRPPRHDGFTAERVRFFLDTLAATGVVADACRAAGVSRVAAYDLRKRASGRAFSLAWDAALLLARQRVADEVMSRSLHGVIDRVYRNGELVAERHRYDNRLTMSVLARLDRQAEISSEGAATARAIAGEWDQFLDIVEAGGGGAEAFLSARPMRLRRSKRKRWKARQAFSRASIAIANMPPACPRRSGRPISIQRRWRAGPKSNGRAPIIAACSTA